MARPGRFCWRSQAREPSARRKQAPGRPGGNGSNHAPAAMAPDRGWVAGTWMDSRLDGFRIVRFAAASLAAAVASGAHGQDLEPRAYANTPVGLNFLIVGYSYQQGGVTVDPTIPLKDAKLQAQGAVFAYARSLDVFGQSGKFDVILPTAWLSGTASFAGQSRERDISGFADPRFRFSVNLYGAPALTLAEFANYEQDVIVGASVQVSVPGGQYDPEKLVNLGTNRWLVKTELGISKRWGPVTLELTGEGTFYTDNDRFLGACRTWVRTK
jgi:hypothetical protein